MVESKHQWKAWLYLAPAIVLLLVFTVWPIINTVSIAFVEGYDQMAALGDASFSVGFGNFTSIVTEYPDFKWCMLNTILLCVLTVPLSTIIALLIAVCLNSIKPLNRTLQTIYFLPYVTNSIAIGMVFYQLFNIVNFNGAEPVHGIINQAFGLTVNWINEDSSYIANLATIVIYIVWNALPFKILILLGGLQSVNKQYYDAAKVDGTSRSRTLWRITVPLLSPMIAYVVITGFIGGFKEYTSVVGVLGEKLDAPATPNHTMNTMVGLIYDLIDNQQGKAAAGALMLFVIIFAVTLVNLRVSKKRVHY